MAEVLCTLSDLEKTGAKEIKINPGGPGPESIFVVKTSAGVAAYWNNCPHADLPLNLAPDKFIDRTKTYILCVNHAAWFEKKTGVCVRGPCTGMSLRPFPVHIEGEDVRRGAAPV